VTQPESFPGRPRGRRARQDNGEPEWQASADQREFPDLPPIRPREARTLDGRGLPGQHARPGQPDGYDGYQGGGPAQAGGGYGSYGGNQYSSGGYGGPGRAPQAPQPPQADPGWAGQPPWPDQRTSAPQYQAPSQPEAAPPPREQRPQEEETPSWAEPDSMQAFSERWHRRGREAHREEQRAGLRKRRRLLIAGGVVVALAIAVTIYLLSGGPGSASFGFGDNFVTNFLPGELQQVPNPCTAVPATTLKQDLPGSPKEAAPPLNSGQSTECSWTLDSPPTYRVLDVQFQAYSPSGLASGDGSATFAAEDAFESFENGYAKPGQQTGLLSSKVTDLSGMPGGTNTSAFQATEVFNRGGATQDLAYVYVRYRNVILRVMVQGLNQSGGGKTYSVQMSTLTGIANTVANEMTGQIAK
jgi:hypothetical protein